jgi:hypothetical protein
MVVISKWIQESERTNERERERAHYLLLQISNIDCFDRVIFGRCRQVLVESLDVGFELLTDTLLFVTTGWVDARSSSLPEVDFLVLSVMRLPFDLAL